MRNLVAELLDRPGPTAAPKVRLRLSDEGDRPAAEVALVSLDPDAADPVVARPVVPRARTPPGPAVESG